MRDVIYAIQGIDGKYLKYNAASDMYKIDATVSVACHTDLYWCKTYICHVHVSCHRFEMS